MTYEVKIERVLSTIVKVEWDGERDDECIEAEALANIEDWDFSDYHEDTGNICEWIREVSYGRQGVDTK